MSAVIFISTNEVCATKTAQQSVQQTAGSLRGLQAFFWLWAFSALKHCPRQPLLTQTVGRWRTKIGTKFSIQKNTLMAFFLLLLLLIIIAVIGKMLYTYLRQEQEKVVKPKDKYDQAWDEFVDKKQSKTMLNMSTHSKKRIAFAVSGLFLFLIGYLIVFVFDFFAPWYKVSTTPDYIFSAKGGTRLSEESWISKPCDYSSPEFSLLTIPSENIVDCVQVHNFYDMWRDAYVRDIYGDVWMWSDGPFTRHFVLYYLVSNSLSFALLCIAILVVWNIGKWIISFFTRRSH